MPLKFCANLAFMFTESDSLVERYELASKSGFKAVECAFPYNIPLPELVQAKTKANVDQILINADPGNLANGDLGLAAIPGREADFRQSLEKSIEYAQALGCNKIHIMAGKTFSKIIDTGMWDIYKENLQYAVELLAEKNIIGLIEPISPAGVADYFMNSFTKGLEIVKQIDSKYLKLQLDVFHLQMLEGNLTNKIKELLPYTGHIQISQAPNRHEPGAAGEIDYKYILNLLEELGYDGYIGLEYKPKVDTVSSLDWIKEGEYQL